MRKDQWIWLPASRYPDSQRTVYSALTDTSQGNYTVAEFQKSYAFDRIVTGAHIRFSGDTACQLYVNGSAAGTGPASVGGDFIGNETVRGPFYAYETDLEPQSKTLLFFARVRMMPVQICEYSKGRGGFMLSALLTFDDGTQVEIGTDETWQCRKNAAYCAPDRYDGRLSPDEYAPAQAVLDVWNAETAPIPVRAEMTIQPGNGRVYLRPHESKTVFMPFDMIYAGFIALRADAQGEVRVRVTAQETDEAGSVTEIVLNHDDTYRGFTLISAGNLSATCENLSDHNALLRFELIETHYPTPEEARIFTSDAALNQVLQTCKHTLQICRQTHHLDSPRHCEPLACTGDYYIESLMTPFAFGDKRLSEFDVIRTAHLLEREDGRMFHTTYSLIWVAMLWDVYMLTGDDSLLSRCKTALDLLLKRFDSYVGENGLIETPPDYMFVDWIYVDGLSLHHPPKALGQTCLNMFYDMALRHAAKVYTQLHCASLSQDCVERSEALRCAINERLYDCEKGMYMMGLNTPTPKRLTGPWMPENTEKAYYLKHANILAAYTGVCDDKTAVSLIERIMSDEIEGDVQPYFLHYLLQAVNRLGLRDRYTLDILQAWKAPVAACPAGLVEGFVKPEPGYRFDHSHAWGGTPLYSLPTALLGLEIVEPGMRELRLKPSLLGLSEAHVELLTPYGRLTCDMKQGEPPRITAPEAIRVRIDETA
ncbi:MAG: hypothetical protein IJJ23_02490 [Clostridia bacterium]|nr:hypothetical protein [Clostridia bacterium]